MYVVWSLVMCQMCACLYVMCSGVAWVIWLPPKVMRCHGDAPLCTHIFAAPS